MLSNWNSTRIGWIVLIVCIFSIAGILLTGTASADTSSSVTLPGNGTAAAPYVISDAAELQAMQNDLSANYTLRTDIDASDTARWEGGAGFDPIGSTDPFRGSLDGQGYSISHLKIDRPSTDRVGVIGLSIDGTVENLHFENASITGGETVGGVVGFNGGTVNNVSVTGTIRSTEDTVGGVVGYNSGDLANASTVGTVHGTEEMVGGIVGYNDGPIDQTYASTTVSGEEMVGGLVGYNDGPIRASFVVGGASGTELIGGLIGVNGNAVNDVYAITDVAGETGIGGLVGMNDGTVTTAYATGAVSGDAGVGGVIGFEDGILTDTYWDINTTNQHDGVFVADDGPTQIAGVTGLQSYELTGELAIDRMAFDLSERSGTWRTTDEYPRLYWEEHREIDDRVYDIDVVTEPPPEPDPVDELSEQSDDSGLVSDVVSMIPVTVTVAVAAVIVFVIGAGGVGVFLNRNRVREMLQRAENDEQIEGRYR